ncbi:MAG: CbtA family protein [Actinomycetota bacterium]|nr:CbtA family protein [Actinomycetota bacterium]
MEDPVRHDGLDPPHPHHPRGAPTIRRLLKQGVLAGIAGGAALAVVLRLIGEGPIGRAVALEGSTGNDMFSRGTQQIGGMLSAVVYGAALGALFTIAFAAVRHQLRATDDWRAAVALAAAGFSAVFLLPFLKYPANPPGVGEPDTITRRTVLYLIAVGWSLVATWGGWRAWRALVARGWAAYKAVPATLLTWVALAAVGLAVLPANSDPVNVPATLIWQFRLATLAGSATFWSVVGLTFGWLRMRDTAAAGA